MQQDQASSQSPSGESSVSTPLTPVVLQTQGHQAVTEARPRDAPQATASRSRWLRWLLLPILLIALAVWHWYQSNHTAPLYKSQPVDHGPITAIVTATGAVNPVVSVQVGSQVSGKIAKLYADFNSVVREGQIIASIDQKPFIARVSQAKAALKNARATVAKSNNMLALRRLERDRTTVLRRQQFVAQSDLDLAMSNYNDAAAQVEAAQAQVDQAQATLDSAELDLGYTTIYSPVNGTVVSRNVEEGQTVAASFQTPTLFVIAQDLTRMQVIANVSESDIGGVAEGKSADFRVDAYPREFFHGIVTQVRNAPISIQNVVTYDVIISVDNRELKLKPGMTANVTIVTARNENALRVPTTALRFRMPGAALDKNTRRSGWWTNKAEPRVAPSRRASPTPSPRRSSKAT
ncbi:MAG: efflux RND transporter periplasmic adaptor subunit [Nitrospiraceae bacterium]